MLGLVLCAFFVFGMFTGFSAVGRALVIRLSTFVSSLTAKVPHSAELSIDINQWVDEKLHWAESRFHVNLSMLRRRQATPRSAGGAIAIVERHDGFYALFSDGELRGPISPNSSDDLPVLSGAGVENARGSDLVEYAAVMVRSEAQLSHMVSEMNIDGDGTASLYLDHARTAVVVDLDAVPLELGRAVEILGKWHDREQMIAAIDMTTPGEAVVRAADVAPAAPAHSGVTKISSHAPAKAARRSTTKPRSP